MDVTDADAVDGDTPVDVAGTDEDPAPYDTDWLALPPSVALAAMAVLAGSPLAKDHTIVAEAGADSDPSVFERLWEPRDGMLLAW